MQVAKEFERMNENKKEFKMVRCLKVPDIVSIHNGHITSLWWIGSV